MNKHVPNDKQRKKKQIEAPVAELNSILEPDKMKQMPKLTKGLEHVIFHLKNTNAVS
jgi:hypothetical protein